MRAVFKEDIGTLGEEQRAIFLGLNLNALGVIIPLDDSGALAFYHIGEVNVAEVVITDAPDIHIATGTEKDADCGQC